MGRLVRVPWTCIDWGKIRRLNSLFTDDLRSIRLLAVLPQKYSLAPGVQTKGRLQNSSSRRGDVESKASRFGVALEGTKKNLRVGDAGTAVLEADDHGSFVMQGSDLDALGTD